MAYERVKLNVYNQLANESGIDPSLLFYVDSPQILDFDIEPDVFTADDAFSIRGKTATIKCVWENTLESELQMKQWCPLYPEYLNYIFDIVDLDTGVVLFRGALRMDEIQHDYDAHTVSLRFRDALDIWITQAKKYYFTATDDVNDWSINLGHPRTFETLLTTPVQRLLMGMSNFYRNFSAGTPQMVNNLAIDFENYSNDFSTWTPVFKFIAVDYDWEARYVVVRHDSDTHEFQVNFIHVFDENSGTWYYRVFKAVFADDNLLQPKLEKYIEAESSQSAATLAINLERLLGVNVTVNADYHYIITNVYTATTTINGYEYTATVTGDILHITQPLEWNTLLLTTGKHSYADITYALLTANALTITAGYGGKSIVNSGLSEALDLTGGTLLTGPYIVNQQRSGLFADVSRLDSALNIIRYNTTLSRALQQIYADRLAQIGAKLTFQMPVDYRDAQGFTVQSKIIIDGITYVITAMGFPQDGLVDIECIGEWE